MTDDIVARLRAPTEHEAWMWSVPYQAADEIERLRAALRGSYNECLNAVEKIKSDPFTQLGEHQKSKIGHLTAKDWMVAFAEDVEREIKFRAALAGEEPND